MIHVHITKEPSGRISAFEMDGHADYAEHGKDLVCAGASAVSFGAVNAIAELTGCTPEIEQGANGGYLRVAFPVTARDAEVQLLVQAMIISLQTIELDYAEYIQLSFTK
ncbi:ribosomal-processing cysteine protease Prp [Sporosarcina sp. PTS2304]|uniref:ribosomal-processing cysteine protease Prp n=1 Tax=Sporosarcina sp. PTS2304 TaxID=2283194 RepID=UPI000E0DC8A3|nr:ribosomal-processing cysteine protease Prp [Sporosarcina sp. PTS2304]AXH99299.1 ribosomal-processing cysteine protease Prp [Sporosarcina sp. PTS2304]